MPIRSSISASVIPVLPPKPRIPFELEFSLRLINAGYEYGNERTTVHNLLADAEMWAEACRQATEHGAVPYSQLCLKHSNLCFYAAGLLEQYEAERKR